MALSLVSQATAVQNAFHIEAEEKGRILIVDDSRLVRSVFLNTLSERYDCMCAESYDEAVECLKMYPFDIVVADVIMPGLSGIELLRKIVSTYPDTVVIMVSGVDRPQRAIDALRLGAFDYLIKPCELPVLEVTIERALEHRELLKNARRYKHDLEERNRELESGRAELQKLQSRVVHNEKMVALGQIAAGIAHELNNPVAFVHSNLEILGEIVGSLVEMLHFYEALELPAEISERAAKMKADLAFASSLDGIDAIVDDCREGIFRIRDIVQNLRTFSRLDEAEFKQTDIHGGLDSTIRLLSQYFGDGRITITRDYAEDLPAIEAFGGQLNQVWMNLLVNAAQSIGDRRGEVRITTRHDPQQVTITIADTGSGIAKQHLSRLFDPFFTTKPIGEGTGLGLSICFGIIERHGGTIAAESTLGRGTAFTVTLPLRMAVAPSADERGITIFDISTKSEGTLRV